MHHKFPVLRRLGTLWHRSQNAISNGLGRILKSLNTRDKFSIKRGKQLYLRKQRYRRLQKYWTKIIFYVGGIFASRTAKIFLVTATLAAYALIATAIEYKNSIIIRPFKVYGGAANNTPGEALSVALAGFLSDVRSAHVVEEATKSSTVSFAFDPVTAFAREIPALSLPQAVNISAEEIKAITPIKIGDISIDIKDWIYRSMNLFQNNVIEGTVTILPDGIDFRLKVPNIPDIVFESRDKEITRKLVSRIASEILFHKDWIKPRPISSEAIASFIEAFGEYRRYLGSGDRSSLIRAEKAYQETIKLDPYWEIARLHLASVQLTLKEQTFSLAAVRNFDAFSPLSDRSMTAKLGSVASITQLVELYTDCNIVQRYLPKLLQAVRDLEAPSVNQTTFLGENYHKDTVLADARRVSAALALPLHRCANEAVVALGPESVEDLLNNALTAYRKALLEFDNSSRRKEYDRTDLWIRFTTALVHTHLAELHVQSGDHLRAKSEYQEALSNRKELRSIFDRLDATRRRGFGFFLSGLIGQDNWRLAYYENTPGKRDFFLSEAESWYKRAIFEGVPIVAGWARLRLVDFFFVTGRYRESLESIDAVLQDWLGSSTVGPVLSIEKDGVVEETSRRCKIIFMLRKVLDEIDDKQQVVMWILLADMYRQVGDRANAILALSTARNHIKDASIEYGPVVTAKLNLSESKFWLHRAMTLEGMLETAVELGNWATVASGYGPSLLTDVIEARALLRSAVWDNYGPEPGLIELNNRGCSAERTSDSTTAPEVPS